MFWRLALVLALAAGPAWAGPQEREMLLGLQAVDARIATIGHRLAVAGEPYCPADAQARSGFAVHSLSQYDPGLRADAVQLFALGERPSVLAVVPGSASDRAGLRANDILLAIDGTEIAAAAPTRNASYDRTAAVETLLEAAARDGVVELVLLRDSTAQSIRVVGDRGCATRFQVIPGKELNASADSIYVQVTTRMVEFVQSDDELALILAHELAHNILKHRDKLDAQGVSRGFLRAFGKNPGRIRATEAEADRLALRLMHAAGYDIGVAPGFWDRFGRKTDRGIFSDRTHAGRTDRIALAEAEIAAIRAENR